MEAAAIIALPLLVLVGIIAHVILLVKLVKAIDGLQVNTVSYSVKTAKKEPKLAECDNILKRKPKYKTDVGWYDWEKQRDREQNR